MPARQAALLERLWSLCRPLLPVTQPSPKGGRPRQDDQSCFFAIVWVLITGARWRDLPPHFPSPVTCWRRHRDWTRAGVWLKAWERVLTVLARAGKLRLDELLADATFAAALKGARRSA